jgi:tRNA(fMet)-specific endonuclease VapC
MSYLLDTCVISELVAKRPEPKVINWIDSIADTRLYLSVITIGEIRKGVEKLPDSKRKTLIRSWLEDQLLIRFDGRIVPIDTDLILTWGQLVGMLEATGKQMAAIDSLIATTALHGRFTLVTRNVEDFKNAGVMILNPWK